MRQYKLDLKEMKLAYLSETVLARNKAINCGTVVGKQLWTGSDCVRIIDLAAPEKRSLLDTACKGSQI